MNRKDFISLKKILRKYSSIQWSAHKEVLREATIRVPWRASTKKGYWTGKWHSKGLLGQKCAHCKGLHRGDETEVDHIEGIGSIPVKHDDDHVFVLEQLVTLVRRLFCSKDNLQVLCKTCHHLKNIGEPEFGIRPNRREQ